MNAQMVLTMGQEALLILLMVSSPVLGVVLVVGLVVSLFHRISTGGLAVGYDVAVFAHSCGFYGGPHFFV